MKPWIILILILLFTAQVGSAQNLPGFIDGRTVDATCIKAASLISERPKEVLFGMDINSSGEVYFTMNNKQWFDKIFAVANSISADIVSKDRYRCGKELKKDGLFSGYVMQPLYNVSFKNNTRQLQGGHISIKVGVLPAEMIGKELEANIIIASNLKVCYYSSTIDIPRAVWQILPMGLYTDTLVQSPSANDTGSAHFVAYSRRIQVIVPFEKNKSAYSSRDFKLLYDSLDLQHFQVRKLFITSYSSIEGAEILNKGLMQARAKAMVNAFRQSQPGLANIKVNSAENWLEFIQDIKHTPFEYLAALPKAEIKQRLLDKNLAAQLETVLAKHRKAIITIYLDKKSPAINIPSQDILQSFNSAVKEKRIIEARVIQKEIVDRIVDNKLPDTYLNRLEVPVEKDYADLLNDREIYKYQLQLTSEYEALEVFNQLKKLDPYNARVNYNICALTLTQWQTGDDSVNVKSLVGDINGLLKLGISTSLVKRMLVNYHILICAQYLQKFQYQSKDSALLFIKDNYDSINLTDEDRYSLAQYFMYYSFDEWALDIITPRLSQLDVSEDIVFYYINLLFYNPGEYESDNFKKAVISAINLNRERYCHFFDPIDKGGASMQLLEYEELRKLYCENCSQ